jgi:hypothetical protein
MNIPYIDPAPLWVYSNSNRPDDVYWIVTKDDYGNETARSMFYYLEDAREYLHKVKGVPLEEIKLVTGELHGGL